MIHLRALSLLLLATFALCACEKEPAWKTQTFRKEDLSRSTTDAHLPTGLWEKITEVLNAPKGEKAAAPAHGEAAADGASEKKGPLPSVFAPLKVYLVEKNRGLLKRGSVEIEFGQGGGELDLAQFLDNKSGSFYVVIEFQPKLEKVDRKVFYLSNSRARKLGDESYGAGCNRYFDISKSFNEEMSRDGWLVNTTADRHVSALAGTYFFAVANEGRLYLASLTLKDSRAPAALLCSQQD